MTSDFRGGGRICRFKIVSDKICGVYGDYGSMEKEVIATGSAEFFGVREM